MEENKKVNGYKLSRQWFDFAFDNPDLISSHHCALWHWIIELCNRLAWKEKFGLPTVYSMEALGIKSYNTYKATLNDLIKWGFITLIEKSRNQYTTNIIAISNFNKAQYKALDKALTKHGTKHNDIDKQVNNKTSKQENDGQPVNPVSFVHLDRTEPEHNTREELHKTSKQENDGQPVNTSEIIEYLNLKTEKQFKANSRQTLNLIQARQNEGWVKADFIKVIDNKSAGWKDDPKMNGYLRPSTLFGTKFESYLNEIITTKGSGPSRINIENENHSLTFNDISNGKN